jgi:hypothetical protein
MDALCRHPLAVPADSSDDDTTAAPPPKKAAARAHTPRRPLYRVVEFTRDDQGRIHEEGRIWHSDLRRVRQFGRAVADNTAGSRVVIADNAGRVVEELPLPGLENPAQGQWQGWRERRLSPLPSRVERPLLKRETATTPAAAWVVPAKTADSAPARADAPAAVASPQHHTAAPPAPNLPLLSNDAAPDDDPSDVEVLLP